MNYRSEGDNKTQYNYINNLTRGLRGNGNICKILNKICKGQNMSAGKKGLNTVGYPIVSSQCDNSTLNHIIHKI